MKNRTMIMIAVSGLSLATSAVQAESFTAKTGKSFVSTSPAKVISSCVNAIEDHHGKDARLFLNKKGHFSTKGTERAFVIQGWVWQNGSRIQATHNCEVNTNGQGLVMTIDYASKEQLASVEPESYTQK